MELNLSQEEESPPLDMSTFLKEAGILKEDILGRIIMAIW